VQRERSPPRIALTTLCLTSMQRRLRPIFCDPQNHTLLVYLPLQYGSGKRESIQSHTAAMSRRSPAAKQEYERLQLQHGLVKQQMLQLWLGASPPHLPPTPQELLPQAPSSPPSPPSLSSSLHQQHQQGEPRHSHAHYQPVPLLPALLEQLARELTSPLRDCSHHQQGHHHISWLSWDVGCRLWLALTDLLQVLEEGRLVPGPVHTSKGSSSSSSGGSGIRTQAQAQMQQQQGLEQPGGYPIGPQEGLTFDSHIRVLRGLQASILQGLPQMLMRAAQAPDGHGCGPPDRRVQHLSCNQDVPMPSPGDAVQQAAYELGGNSRCDR